MVLTVLILIGTRRSYQLYDFLPAVILLLSKRIEKFYYGLGTPNQTSLCKIGINSPTLPTPTYFILIFHMSGNLCEPFLVYYHKFTYSTQIADILHCVVVVESILEICHNFLALAQLPKSNSNSTDDIKIYLIFQKNCEAQSEKTDFSQFRKLLTNEIYFNSYSVSCITLQLYSMSFRLLISYAE